jgi:hypothetical protein
MKKTERKVKKIIRDSFKSEIKEFPDFDYLVEDDLSFEIDYIGDDWKD